MTILGAMLLGCLTVVEGNEHQKGMYLRNIDVHDGLLLENLGMHTKVQGSRILHNEREDFCRFHKRV